MRHVDSSALGEITHGHIGTTIIEHLNIFNERLQKLLNRRKARGQNRADPSSEEEWLGRKRRANQTFFSLWPELDESRKRMKHQRKSYFLELPFEIREEIFRLAIGTDLLHLVDMTNRTGFIRCTAHDNAEGSFWKQKTCDRNCASPLWRLVSYRSTPTFEGSSGFPALLLTCQQNYTQGVGVLYSSNVFEAEYPETVVSLAESIRPSLLGSIRFLQISGRARILNQGTGIDRYWDEMWEVICHQMTSLRSLEVKLRIQLQTRISNQDNWNNEAHTILREWLRMPVEHLRRLKHFHLDLYAPFFFFMGINDPTCTDQSTAFQDKLEMLVCSSTPKGFPENFPELFNCAGQAKRELTSE